MGQQSNGVMGTESNNFCGKWTLKKRVLCMVSTKFILFIYLFIFSVLSLIAFATGQENKDT